MFLFMIPVDLGGAVINTAIAPVEVVVETPASYNGEPTQIQISSGVTLTMEDGFTVTMGQAEANIVLAPVVESEEDYHYRLCMDYYEVKTWFENDCVKP